MHIEYDMTKVQNLREISKEIYYLLNSDEKIKEMQEDDDFDIETDIECLYKNISKMLASLEKDFEVAISKLQSNKNSYVFTDSTKDIFTLYRLHKKTVIKKLRRKSLKIEDFLSGKFTKDDFNIIKEFFKALYMFQRKNLQQTSMFRLKNADINELYEMDTEQIVEKYSEDAEIEHALRWTNGYLAKYACDDYFEIIMTLKRITEYTDAVLSSEFMTANYDEDAPYSIIDSIKSELNKICWKIPKIVENHTRNPFYSLNIDAYLPQNPEAND